MNTLWSRRFSLSAGKVQNSTIREMLKLTSDPEVISFGGGLPAPDAFPVSAVREAVERVLGEHGAEALQYGATEGYSKLRSMIARHTARYGIVAQPENILITSGSQQALDLIGRAFLNPGDTVLTERPTYLGALQAWNAYQARYVSIDVDSHGIQTGCLEAALHVGPKFIYVLPNFQNPTGVTMSAERRQILVQCAHHYGTPIIEDDPYGQLRYEGEHLPALLKLEDNMRHGRPYDGNVIYLSTFSKTLAPGLRLGWVVAPVEVIQKLVALKQGADLHTSTFTQMVAFEVAKGGFLDNHVRFIRAMYRERRDAMFAALERYFPIEVVWTRPAGGLFLWVTLPAQVDATELLHLSILEKVAFVPGASFYPEAPQKNTLRLNFSNSDPARIGEGIRRLAFVLGLMLESGHMRHLPRPNGSKHTVPVH